MTDFKTIILSLTFKSHKIHINPEIWENDKWRSDALKKLYNDFVESVMRQCKDKEKLIQGVQIDSEYTTIL